MFKHPSLLKNKKKIDCMVLQSTKTNMNILSDSVSLETLLHFLQIALNCMWIRTHLYISDVEQNPINKACISQNPDDLTHMSKCVCGTTGLTESTSF